MFFVSECPLILSFARACVFIFICVNVQMHSFPTLSTYMDVHRCNCHFVANCTVHYDHSAYLANSVDDASACLCSFPLATSLRLPIAGFSLPLPPMHRFTPCRAMAKVEIIAFTNPFGDSFGVSSPPPAALPPPVLAALPPLVPPALPVASLDSSRSPAGSTSLPTLSQSTYAQHSLCSALCACGQNLHKRKNLGYTVTLCLQCHILRSSEEHSPTLVPIRPAEFAFATNASPPSTNHSKP
jgi:hypothetical protein